MLSVSLELVGWNYIGMIKIRIRYFNYFIVRWFVIVMKLNGVNVKWLVSYGVINKNRKVLVK